MKFNILKYLLIVACLSCGLNLWGQGLVARPTTPDKPNEPKVTINKSNGYNNGHEWVDLGLSVKWATCNVGASTPSDYGNYYAWGETTPKSTYKADNSLTFYKTESTLQSEGIINSRGVLNKKYDAASYNWGGSWRMPTKAEFEELCNKCKWEWSAQGGKTGYRVFGPNGNSIFLTAGGCRLFESLNSVGRYGKYWSSSVWGDNFNAYYLFFNKDNPNIDKSIKSDGCLVRPVSE